MQPYIDYATYGIEIGPTVPFWFLIPFIICLGLMLTGGVSFGSLDEVKNESTFIQWVVGLGVLKLVTFMPYGMILGMAIISVVADNYELYAWQVALLLAMLFGAYFKSCSLMTKSLLERRTRS